MAGESFEVGIGMKQWEGAPNRVRRDEAVHQPAHRLTLATTGAIEAGCLLVVAGYGLHQEPASQQPAKVTQVPIASCAGQHFHPNGMAGGDLAVEEAGDPLGRLNRGVQGTTEKWRRTLAPDS